MILYVFRNHYTMHVTAAMFYRTVSIIGHGLLLVVPGIIKHYEYSLIPYILAENPTMQYKRAAQLSTKNVRRAEDGDAENGSVLSFLGDRGDFFHWVWFRCFTPCRTGSLQRPGFMKCCGRMPLRTGFVTARNCPVLRRIWAYKCRIYEIFRKKLWFC